MLSFVALSFAAGGGLARSLTPSSDASCRWNRSHLLQRELVAGERPSSLLQSNFPTRWIGRDGPIHCSARSPDLSPLDFHLWGFVKDRVYWRRPSSLLELHDLIEKEMMSAPVDHLPSYTFSKFERHLQLRTILTQLFLVAHLKDSK